MPAILGFLGNLIGPILKLVPFIGAYFYGQSRADASLNKNTLEAKDRGEKEVNKVKEEIRDTSTADYIRNNDI